MIRRTIEISREPARLCVKDGQLLVLREGQRSVDAPMRARIPFEDLGLIMLDERDTTISHTVLANLAEHGGAMVVCGRDHLPCGVYLPLSRNTELLRRLEAQIGVSKPILKRTWAEIVAAKVRAQAETIEPHDDAVATKLRALARRVRSGDPENIESQAARLYWRPLFAGIRWLDQPFRRSPGDRGAPPPNNLLDYGYAAMRAAVARAIVSAGLLPAIGIKHGNRSNAFALADDLVEPLRPIVDARVRRLAAEGRLGLDQSTKAELLILLDATVGLDASGRGKPDQSHPAGPLQIALVRYVASFVRRLEGESEGLAVPVRMIDSKRGRERLQNGGEEDDE